MEDSILISTKKVLGLASDYTPFDLDITIFINSTFSIINQLGVIADPGFSIEDETAMWADLGLSDNITNVVKTYMFLKVRALFDQPTSRFVIQSISEQLIEYEYRLSYLREDLIPLPTPIVEEVRHCWI